MSSAEMDGIRNRFEQLSTENGLVGEIAKEHLYLIKIREGDISVWKECIALERGNSLSDACRSEAWAIIPKERKNVTVDKLKSSLKELNEWMEIRDIEMDNSRLCWAIVETMSNSNKIEEIEDIFVNLTITNNDQLTIALSLLNSNIHNLVIEKLEGIIKSNRDFDLRAILEYESIPTKMPLEVSE